jgi:CRISPR-associated protein Cmr1
MMKLRDPKKQFPNIEKPPEVVKKPDDRITETRKYRLITPLFGGGVKTQEADPLTVIRGASVRGQLRFWWRATRGGQFNGDLEAMRKAENAIWGSAAKKGDENTGPSKVQVVVLNIQNGNPLKEIEIKKKGQPLKVDITGQDSPLSYVTFSLREDDKKSDNALREKVAFTLEIRYPAPQHKKGILEVGVLKLCVQDEVSAAIWAWETFGGIGARTRRGFGSLQLTEYLIDGEKKAISYLPFVDTEKALQKLLDLYIAKGQWQKDFAVPHLANRPQMVIVANQQSPFDAWKALIKAYQNFRQHRFKDKHGMTKWPEANQIRRMLGRKSKWPKDVDWSNMKGIAKFPRAVFGLPVVFHFPTEEREVKHEWSKKSFILQGKSASSSDHRYERMASPLIIKPVPVGDNLAVGLAIVLDGIFMPPNGLEIIEYHNKKAKPPKPITWQKLTVEEANSQPIKDILNGNNDVIAAFLEELAHPKKKR